MTESANAPLRLQVYLSRNGVSSRRKAMEIIQAGRVKVNGTTVFEPSFKVTSGQDKVTVNGKPVESAKKQYLLLKKQNRGSMYVVIQFQFDNKHFLLEELNQNMNLSYSEFESIIVDLYYHYLDKYGRNQS